MTSSVVMTVLWQMQGENIKAYKYKWSQLGAVSVGFRVFFD